MERVCALQPASFFVSGVNDRSVPSFHLIPPHIRVFEPELFRVRAWNGGTPGAFFEWERVFRHPFHYGGTVERSWTSSGGSIAPTTRHCAGGLRLSEVSLRCSSPRASALRYRLRNQGLLIRLLVLTASMDAAVAYCFPNTAGDCDPSIIRDASRTYSLRDLGSRLSCNPHAC